MASWPNVTCLHFSCSPRCQDRVDIFNWLRKIKRRILYDTWTSYKIQISVCLDKGALEHRFICFQITRGCFRTTMAELNGCDRNCVAYNTCKVYYLPSTENKFPTPSLDCGTGRGMLFLGLPGTPPWGLDAGIHIIRGAPGMQQALVWRMVNHYRGGLNWGAEWLES